MNDDDDTTTTTTPTPTTLNTTVSWGRRSRKYRILL